MREMQGVYTFLGRASLLNQPSGVAFFGLSLKSLEVILWPSAEAVGWSSSSRRSP